MRPLPWQISGLVGPQILDNPSPIELRQQYNCSSVYQYRLAGGVVSVLSRLGSYLPLEATI